MKDTQCTTEYQPNEQEEARYVDLARMARRRRETPCPDADKAWEEFAAQHRLDTPVHRQRRWQLWAAAVAGAAAMLAGVLLYNYLAQPESVAEAPSTVVAMAYDNRPQSITLQEEKQITDLSQRDSLSYRTPSSAAAVSQPVVAAVPSAAVRMQKLSTPRGMDFKVILPDGSEVWLNAESTIEFPTAFTAGERRVNLKGEAYFKVARNEQAPFIVASDEMQVRVLGTEFNFKSYSSEPSHVSLVKGAVEVSRPGADTPLATLQPGQDAWRDEAGDIRIRDIDTYAVTQWVHGFFYFDDIPLVEILRELGRWYNLGVVFHNRPAMECRMHFSASRDEDITQAIENLNRLRKARVAIEGKNIVVY